MKDLICALLLVLMFLVFCPHVKAQAIYSQSQLLNSIISASNDFSNKGDSTNNEVSCEDQNNGEFFITPFYQFIRFKELKLSSHTSHYRLYEGELSDGLPQEALFQILLG